MYELRPKLTKEYILSQVSQEEIFERYLGIPIQFNNLFCSPVRNDKYPTCSFKWLGDRLNYRDWAEYDSKDCFQIVKELYGCNFYESLEIIYNDIIKQGDIQQPLKVNNRRKQSNNYHKSIINVKRAKQWYNQDIEYLKSYSISGKTASKFNVYSISHVWLNNKLIYKRGSEPALGYFFGLDENNRQKWKIYFYNRKDLRFIGNTNRINGWVQLPDRAKILVITKSLKDVMCLYEFGIPAIAMQNETTIPYDYIIEKLEARFDNIISLYDYDRTGVINANKLWKYYNIPYFFFRKYENVKDFSDYVKQNGKHQTNQLLECIRSKYFSHA